MIGLNHIFVWAHTYLEHSLPSDDELPTFSHTAITTNIRGVLYGSILWSYLKCTCLYVFLVPFYEERAKINFFSKIFNFWRFPTEKMKMAGFWPKIQVFFNVFQRFPRNETCGAYKHHFGMAKHIVKYVIDDIYPKTG